MLKHGKPYFSYATKGGAWLKVWSFRDMANTWLKWLFEVFIFTFSAGKSIAVFWTLLSYCFPQHRENTPLPALLWVLHHAIYGTEDRLFRIFNTWKSGKARIIRFVWNPNSAVRQHSYILWPCSPQSPYPLVPPLQVCVKNVVGMCYLHCDSHDG